MKRTHILPLLLTLLLLLTACQSGNSAHSSSASSAPPESSISSSVSSESESVPEILAPESSESSEPDNWEPYYGNPVVTPGDASPDPTIAERYQAAKAANEEVVAWLQIPGTEIDTPVVQHTDNDFYLTHDAEKNESKNGAIYAHYNNYLADAHYLPKNTVLFGHNMWIYNNKMFTTLEKYYDLAHADQHRYITLTIGDETTYWLIYGIFDTEIAKGDAQYDFYYWNTFGQSEEEWLRVQEQIAERSLYDYDLDVSYEDNILMLSTCSYHYGSWFSVRDDVRLVLVARLLREGETLADAPVPVVNTDRREPA